MRNSLAVTVLGFSVWGTANGRKCFGIDKGDFRLGATSHSWGPMWCENEVDFSTNITHTSRLINLCTKHNQIKHIIFKIVTNVKLRCNNV